MVVIPIVAVLSLHSYWTEGTTFFQFNSLGSSTIAFPWEQLKALRAGHLLPLHWMASWAAGGPAHTGIPMFNPLFALFAPAGSLEHALIGYDLLLKIIGGVGVFILMKPAGQPARILAMACLLLNGVHPALGQDLSYSQPLFLLPWVLIALDWAWADPSPSSRRMAWPAFVLALAVLASSIVAAIGVYLYFLLPVMVIMVANAGVGRDKFRQAILLLLLHGGLIAYELLPHAVVLSSGDRTSSGYLTLVRSVVIVLLVTLLAVFFTVTFRHGRPAMRRLAALIWFAGIIFCRDDVLRLAGAPLRMLFDVYFGASIGTDSFIFELQSVRSMFTTGGTLLLGGCAIHLARGEAVPRAVLLPISICGAFFLAPTILVWLFGPSSSFVPLFYYRSLPVAVPGFALAQGIGFITVAGWLKTRLTPSSARLAGGLLVVAVSADLAYALGKCNIYTDALKFTRPSFSREAGFLAEIGPLARVMDTYEREHVTWPPLPLDRHSLLRYLYPVYHEASTFSRVGVSSVNPVFNLYYGKAVPEYFGTSLSRPTNPLLDLAGVEYILSRERPASSTLEPIVKGESYDIYRNPGAFPRAWLSYSVQEAEDDVALSRLADGDGRGSAFVPPGTGLRLERHQGEDGTVRVIGYEHERVEIETSASQPAFLVLADAFDSAWKATVDGRPVVLVRTNLIFRGLPLPPGRHRVIMTYHPPVRTLGLAISGLCLIICVGLALSGVARPKRSKADRRVLRR